MYNVMKLNITKTPKTLQDCFSAFYKKMSSSIEPPTEGNSTSVLENINVGIVGGGMSPIYASLLLKQSSIVKRVHFVDMGNCLCGYIFDAAHIDTDTKLKYFRKENLADAVREVDIIALMDETDFQMGKASAPAQFASSSNYVEQIAKKLAKACPRAIVAVFANPVTMTLPLVSEVYRNCGQLDPNKIVGSVSLHSMRIDTVTANYLDLNPTYVSIPLAGGADAATIIPLFSWSRPINQFTIEQETYLRHRLKTEDQELAATEAKGPTISAGVSTAKLITTIGAGLSGYKNVIASVFVRSNVLPMCRYFTNEIQFGPPGVFRNLGLPKVSKTELSLLESTTPILNDYVNIGTSTVCKKKHINLKI